MAAGPRTGTFIFPGNATNGFAGDSILVGTTQFDSAATVLSDFTMVTNLNANDGRLCFTSSTEILIVDCVAYGNFTGDNTGFGGPAAPLPITGNFSLRRGSSTNNNAADFQLGTPAPRNNARQTGQVVPPQPQLVSIAVAPDSPSIQVGETQQVFGHGHLHRRQHEHGYYSDNLGKLGPDGCHNQQRGRK